VKGTLGLKKKKRIDEYDKGVRSIQHEKIRMFVKEKKVLK
jgi:hypothetical protein